MAPITVTELLPREGSVGSDGEEQALRLTTANNNNDTTKKRSTPFFNFSGLLFPSLGPHII
jgi:hypothetical protein